MCVLACLPQGLDTALHLAAYAGFAEPIAALHDAAKAQGGTASQFRKLCTTENVVRAVAGMQRTARCGAMLHASC